MRFYNIIAKLLYLCKIYIHGDFNLSKMPKQSHHQKWCNKQQTKVLMQEM